MKVKPCKFSPTFGERFFGSARSLPAFVTMAALTFNLDDGFTEAVVRGYRSGILSAADYSNLGQCDGLEDMRMHLAVTDYGNFLQNEPAPLQTMTISEKCTEKLVDEFNYLRCNASGELAKFLDYITYGSPTLPDPPPPTEPGEQQSSAVQPTPGAACTGSCPAAPLLPQSPPVSVLDAMVN